MIPDNKPQHSANGTSKLRDLVAKLNNKTSKLPDDGNIDADESSKLPDSGVDGDKKVGNVLNTKVPLYGLAAITKDKGIHYRATTDIKNYKDAMPDGLIRHHVEELQKSMGLKTERVDMVSDDGHIIPLTEAERRSVGDLPAVHLRNLGLTGRARLTQLAENPDLITDYLAAGITPNRLAAMVDMTVGAFEKWVAASNFLEHYSLGRRLASDIYVDKAVESLESVPDLLGEVNNLSEKMRHADPNDSAMMEEIRMDEWRLGVLKAGGDYALKRTKMLFGGYLKLAQSISPERYAPRQAPGSEDVRHGDVQLNILMGTGGGNGGAVVINGGESDGSANNDGGMTGVGSCIIDGDSREIKKSESPFSEKGGGDSDNTGVLGNIKINL